MANNIFQKDPPISGGNFYSSKQVLEAKETLLNSYNLADKIDRNVKKYLNSANFTYNLYFLLNFQADYFTNLVKFRFNNKFVTEALYKAIRCCVIYGKSAIWINKNGVIPYYINKVEYSPVSGKPIYMECAIIDSVFSQQTIEPKNLNVITFNINEHSEAFDNIYILNYCSSGLGGLVKWTPFLKQLEALLKMIFTHSYSYIKFILYEIKDPSYVDKELSLFFNNELPFLINLGSDNLIKNKFKEFNFNSTGKAELFEFLEKFLNTYYNLIGRRYNIDFKKERNISSEVEASQFNFDNLENEFSQYIILLLDWIQFKTGLKYVI